MRLEDIRERVAALDADMGWYQNIDLKCGISTKSRQVWGEDIDHPRRRWEFVRQAFPPSFAGKSVLDVGCNAGFFSFVAAERGASYVCGVDYSKKYIEQAIFCNEVRGDNVEFVMCDATALHKLNRTFDITLCIGLLYHVTDILGSVRQIAKSTNEMAIVESAILNDDDVRPMVLMTAKDPKKPGSWHPNIRALRDMFEAAGFARTEPLFKSGGRGGIVAYK